jgi:hypothetical protein
MSMSVLNEDQQKALRQLLESADRADWDYYKRGGWAGTQLHPLIEADPRKPIKPWLTEQQVRALFELNNVHVYRVYTLANEYWPEAESYTDLRLASPWFLVKTKKGLVKVGWRKNVLVIDWCDTDIKKVVTEDSVTKDDYMVHAWSMSKAVEYMSVLGAEINK